MALTFFSEKSRHTFKLLKISLLKTHLRTISCKGIVNKKSVPVGDGDNEELDKPIQYSKSEAAKLTAAEIRSGGTRQSTPWFQSYVISLSLTIFMVYFFYLREESDVDLELSKNLYDRISGLEEKNLEIVLDYNRSNKLPTADIERRLEEIRNNK